MQVYSFLSSDMMKNIGSPARAKTLGSEFDKRSWETYHIETLALWLRGCKMIEIYMVYPVFACTYLWIRIKRFISLNKNYLILQ